MKLQNKSCCFAALVAAVLVGMSGSAYAQGNGHGGGGGGGGSTGGTGDGTIYFINGAGGGFNSNYTWSMGSDGSNVTLLKNWGYFNEPSRTLHNGYRWYLTTLTIPGEYYPDGVTRRMEVFAIRGDYDNLLNNNPETRVQLTNNPNLQPYFGWWQGMHWLPGDQQISFKARRWDNGVPVDSGLYTAQLQYRGDGNVIGLDGGPTEVLNFPLDGTGTPTLNTHTWDPTGTKVAYTDYPVTGLWVADLSRGTRARIFTGGSVTYPDWSPDGSKILFTYGTVQTIKPNGTGRKSILGPTYVDGVYVSGFAHAYFSPTGSHITCVGIINSSGGTDNDVFRATSTGGSLTNLTNTPDLVEGPIAWRAP